MSDHFYIYGCGYLGQLVAKQLLEQKLSVHGVVRSEETLEKCRSLGIPVSAIDLDSNESLLPDTSNASILYLIPPPVKGVIDTRIDNFVIQLKNKLPNKIVLLSTTGVYGNCHGQWVDENTPVNPQVDRAKRRVDAEKKMQAFCTENNIPLTILRVAGIYGPNKLPIKRVSSGEPIVSEEDSPFSNRIHADDLTNICCEALLNEKIEGIYNCADGNPTTMFDYFTKVAKASGLPQPPSISLHAAQQQLSKGMLSYMAESRRIDNSKLLNDFGMTLKYPDLDAGLAFLAKT